MILRCFLLTVILLPFFEATASGSFPPRFSSQQRASLLTQCCELATDVVVGSIEDTMFFRDSRYIYTRYTVRVATSIKGQSHSGDAITFARKGGRMGKTGASVTSSLRIVIGDEYLLFLAPCGAGGYRGLMNETEVAKIQGDSAIVIAPPLVESSSALLDSVRTFVAACNPGSRQEAAAAIVEASVTHMEAARQSAGVTATVNNILVQRDGPTIAPHASLRIVMPPVNGPVPKKPSSAIGGARLHLQEGASYIFFLERSGDEWALRSQYSAWMRQGEQALVLAQPRICAEPITLARMPWDSLLAQIGE